MARILRKFYCEARPKESAHRMKNLGENMAATYHKNTMKNMRAALNRFLQDNGRNIDIIRGPAFKSANNTLDGLLKAQTRTGLSRPTQHKQIIEEEDLRKISAYMSHSETSPIILRQCVWYNLAIHFVSRGLEFHHQLKRDSFNFLEDQDGRQYVTLNHETQQKNFQGGLTKDEAPVDRRMYASGAKNCPVAMLKLLIEKTDPAAEYLFNNCYKEALKAPVQMLIWYGSKPLAKRTFTNFMADISKSSGLRKWYTPHCLRATAIQAMNDSGFESRHIMFMSGHRSEASLKFYSRNPCSDQKRALSTALSNVVLPTQSEEIKQNLPEALSRMEIVPASEMEITSPKPKTMCATDSPTDVSLAAQNRNQDLCTRNSNTLSFQNENHLSSLFQSGSFQSCAFHITLNQPK